jgi:hypothetical protein
MRLDCIAAPARRACHGTMVGAAANTAPNAPAAFAHPAGGEGFCLSATRRCVKNRNREMARQFFNLLVIDLSTSITTSAILAGIVRPARYEPDPGGPFDDGVLITIQTIMSQALRMAANSSVSTAAAIKSALIAAAWVSSSAAATNAST